MRWQDTEASQCRWAEYAEELFYDWDIVWDNSTVDYQGSGEFLARKDNKYAYCTWSYGSCSGCDGWEDLPEEEVRADFKNGVEYFEDIHDLKKWANFQGDGNIKKFVNEMYESLEQEFIEAYEDSYNVN